MLTPHKKRAPQRRILELYVLIEIKTYSSLHLNGQYDQPTVLKALTRRIYPCLEHRPLYFLSRTITL